jgi:homoserine kinase type II
MFRDNVLFEGAALTAIIDWESACDHALLYDLAVVLLAWCWGDALDVGLAHSLVESYRAERPLTEIEIDSFSQVAGLAAVRFSATRITDFHLRGGDGGKKDYRRFLARLDAIERFDAKTIRGTLF